MDAAIERALGAGGIADITTTGRSSGRARRIEVYFHNLDGALYITGRPGKRDWYANVVADPAMVLHLKRGVTADLAAGADPVTDSTERRRILWRLLTERFQVEESQAEEVIATWVAESPLVRLTLSG